MDPFYKPFVLSPLALTVCAAWGTSAEDKSAGFPVNVGSHFAWGLGGFGFGFGFGGDELPYDGM